MATAPDSSSFAKLVDEYLEQFAERHPSIAAGNGLHNHDIDQTASFFERSAHLPAPAARGDRFDLREFHERMMTNGIAPWWAHRQLLLSGDSSPVIE